MKISKTKAKRSKENEVFKAAKNVKIFFACLFSYLLLFWLFPVYSFPALFLLIGLMIVILNNGSHENIYIGALVGFCGGTVASLALTVDKYIYYVNTMPANVNPDIPMSLYTNTLFNLVKLTPISFMNPLLFIFISTLLCTAFTQLDRIRTKNIKNITTYACVSILAINFLFISLFSSRDSARFASVEPPNLSYGYDAVVLMKTVYLMRNKGYYKAHIDAQYNDTRRNKDGTWTQQGAQPGTSPLMIRHPFIFYFWKYISSGDLSRVIYFSIFFCTTLIVLSYTAAKRLIGEYSIFAPVLIIPFLFTGTNWLNIFFPDWWAGLFLFSALLCWILKKYWITALFLLFALLSREVVAFYFVIFIIAAAVKDRAALRPLLISGVTFSGLYVLHYINAGHIIMGVKSNVSIDTITTLFAFRLIPSSSYLMFFYGFFKIPVYFILFISAVISILSRKLEFILITLYSLLHSSFASSSYWGNHSNLTILFLLILILNPRGPSIYPRILQPYKSASKSRKKFN